MGLSIFWGSLVVFGGFEGRPRHTQMCFVGGQPDVFLLGVPCFVVVWKRGQKETHTHTPIWRAVHSF